uniref:28S ribosomal protein S14, mitochondrial n=2 Tax=Anolis carolinensis TaxID=28377 RepID=A0A803TRZ3_ANOCA|nr:PREDICTED: 28S ribosomal protein S14, mitochondrial [Anolis carolinensis]|eukprot:XP_008107148.1 PREDICTED: 28S ribosomal protein S14, mitochondrial [Anolis carolinensis]
MLSYTASLRRLTALWGSKMAAATIMSLVRQGHRQMSCMPCFGQGRSYYVDWRMLRDVKRRKMAFEYADQRLRLDALRKNKILPKELQEVASQEIAALPRDSCPVRIRNRCVLTSRPRGVVWRWRLSRIVFRHLADHAQLSGVQRAMW